jgi:hypothetical protein
VNNAEAPRGLHSLIPGSNQGFDTVPPPSGAAWARAALQATEPVQVPRAVVEATAEMLRVLALTAADELADVARSLAARLDESTR